MILELTFRLLSVAALIVLLFCSILIAGCSTVKQSGSGNTIHPARTNSVDWNRIPHGGSDEKSSNAPQESDQRSD